MAHEADTEAVASIDNQTAANSLAGEIRRGIEEGRYPVNSRLPSERAICEEYGVSRRAARQCVDLLEREGLVHRLHRSGVFVRNALPATNDGGEGRRVRAITFIEDHWPVPADRRAILADYLSAYTQVLDHTEARMRFEPYLQDRQRFEDLLSGAFAVQEQACVLVNVASADLMNWLHARGIPFVVQYFCHYDRQCLPDHHGVSINKFQGAFDAVKFLVETGHRRIAFIGGGDHKGVNPAHDGYIAAMRWAGCALPRNLLSLETDSADVAHEPARRFLKANRGMTALFAQNDAVAIGALRAAHDLGIRVPEELSVIGFNDIPAAAESTPALTTVASPRRQLARTAIEILLNAARGAYRSWQQTVLNCRLVIRDSVAPLRPGGQDGAREPLSLGEEG